MRRRNFLGLLLLAASFAAASRSPAKEKKVSVARIIAAHGISFQVGPNTIPPQAFTEEKLLQEVAKFNADVRLPGLADELNAEVLDPEKVRAFLDGLAGLEEKALALVAGRTVRLNFTAMHLHLSSAATARQLRAGYRIEHDSANPNAHLATVQVIVPLSSDLARRRIQAARDAIAQRDARLRELSSSATAATLPQAARLRQERRSAAMVWLALALDLARQHPAPPDAAALVDEAKKVLEMESVAPSNGGMPG